MQIENQIFYHIHTPDSGTPELEIGKQYEAGNEANRFWRFYLEQEFRCGITPYHGDHAAIALDRHINSPLIENPDLNKEMLKYSSSVLFECGMLLREMIFEEIRLREYHEAPSRRTALFITNEVGLQYWMRWFVNSPRPKFLYRIQCSGIIHRGSQQYLDSDITSYSDYEKEARNYWSGVNTDGKANTEILFHGVWRILELIGSVG